MGKHLFNIHHKHNIMKAFSVLVLIPLVAAGPAHPAAHQFHFGAAAAAGYGHPVPHPAPAAAGYGHPAPHPAPAYGGYPAAPAPAYGGYGYEEPKHNCTVRDVIEAAEVCTPALEVICVDEVLPIKEIVDMEFTYTVTRTVCTESIQEIPNEVCSYSYLKKDEDTTAKTVEVTHEKQTNVQMVTVCQPGSGYGGYGHNYCQEVAQETAYQVPIVTPVDIPVTVSYPSPIKSCVDKPISLPVVSCEDLSEEKTILVPEIQESTVTVAKCQTQLAAPNCVTKELTLPKQVCVELVYGYAHEPVAHAAPQAAAEA